MPVQTGSVALLCCLRVTFRQASRVIYDAAAEKAGGHAVVQGKMTFKREVDLYVSDSATIGAIEGATPTKFSGDQP